MSVNLRHSVFSVLFLAALFIAPVASAAGLDVVQKNIERSSVSQALRDWSIKPTLATGYFALRHPSGKYEPYIANEAVTMLRTDKGWQKVTSSGLVPLTQAEERALFADIFQKLRRDKAIASTYGEGKTPLVLISAADCPTCMRLERTFEEAAEKLNVTVYLFPMALDYRNAPAMKAVTALWCSADPRAAWRAKMGVRGGGGAVPPGPAPDSAGRCADLKSADETRVLARMFGAPGVPTVIRADGEVVRSAGGETSGGLIALLSR